MEILKADIDLAYKTLQLIGELKDEQIPSSLVPRMRDIVANLCDFQYRCSKPMELPFGLGQDMEEALEMPRPTKVILKYRAAYAFDHSKVKSSAGEPDLSDRFVSSEDGKEYCLAGGKTWAQLVAQGTLTGSDAAAPELSAWRWLPELFALLVAIGSISSEHRHKARKLAACWYHIATQASFAPDLDEEEAAADAEALANPEAMMMTLMASGAMGGLIGLAGAVGGADGDEYVEEDEEDDQDDDEEEEEAVGPTIGELLEKGDMMDEDEEGDADYNPVADPDDGNDEEIVDADDGDDDAMDTDEPSTFADMLAKNLKISEGGAKADDAEDKEDDEEDGDFQPAAEDEDDDDMPDLDDAEEEEGEGDEDDMDDDYYDEDEEETEEEKQFRETILGHIGSLNAVYPDPTDDLLWVKRTLKHAAIAMNDPRSLAWFPWGIPPIEPLTRAVKSSDPLEQRYGLTVLSLYSQLMPQEGDDEDDAEEQQ